MGTYGMPGNVLLGSALVIACGALKVSQNVMEIEPPPNVVEQICGKEWYNVTLHLDTLHNIQMDSVDVMWLGESAIPPPSNTLDPCMTTVDQNHNQNGNKFELSLNVKHPACAPETVYIKNTVVYLNWLWLSGRSRGEMRLLRARTRCVLAAQMEHLHAQRRGERLLNKAIEKSGASLFRLELSPEKWDTAEYSPWLLYPQAMVLGKQVFAQVTFMRPMADTDLRPMPLDCYLGSNSHPEGDPDAHILLASGCPRDRSVAVFHTPKPHAQFARFVFRASNERYTSRENMFLHCKVAVCSERGGRIDEDYPDCPVPTYCSSLQEIGGGRPVVPFPSRPKASFVKVGPLRVAEIKPHIIYSGDGFYGSHIQLQKDQPLCPPCAAALPLQPGSSGSSEPIPSASGLSAIRRWGEATVSLWVAAALVVLSFLIGAALVAAIWWIYVNTKKQKPQPSYDSYNCNGHQVLQLGTSVPLDHSDDSGVEQRVTNWHVANGKCDGVSIGGQNRSLPNGLGCSPRHYVSKCDGSVPLMRQQDGS